ncbi:hypothetical protein D3C87_750700 [compost metagenome]
MMRWTLLALPALSLVVVGCSSHFGAPLATSDASTLAARNTQSIYPLTKGLTWRFQTVSRSGDGPERPGPEQFSQVVESEYVLGQVRAVVVRKVGDREFPPTRAVVDARAVTLSRANTPEDGSITVLNFPLDPGRTWPGRSWGAQAQETITVVGTESVTVPAGTFEATRTRHRIAYATGTEDLLHYWYVPGIGMVKAIEGLTVDLGQGPVLQQVTAELKSWGKP